MSTLRTPHPALLIVAAFSRHPETIDWARRLLEPIYGPVTLVSPAYEFNQTRYYEPSMGAGLQKCFLTFRDLVAANCLPAVKMHTNDLEHRLSGTATYPELRPLNLDPGLLFLGKFLLASTKDQSHRIYLRDGIFAEVTLRYRNGAFEPWPWTYADYRQPVVLDFLQQARDYYRKRLEEVAQGASVGSGEGA